MINPKNYGTAGEVSKLVGINRKTLWAAMNRREEILDVVETIGGTLLVHVDSAKDFKRNPPRRGPKTKW